LIQAFWDVTLYPWMGEHALCSRMATVLGPLHSEDIKFLRNIGK